MQVKFGEGDLVVPVGNLRISSTGTELKATQDVAKGLALSAEIPTRPPTN